MELNLSNTQTGWELDMTSKTAQEKEVEIDEMDLLSGHKGQSEEIKKPKKTQKRCLKGGRGRSASKSEKLLVLGMVQRDGQMVLRVLDNVQQTIIKSIIEKCIHNVNYRFMLVFCVCF